MPAAENETALVKFFLCGDVMLGRGIDQILPFSSNPVIHESFMKSAEDYVEIAEAVSGPIPRQVEFSYIWGDALDSLARHSPQARLMNLETTITSSDRWEDKGINYRMHPGNVPAITAAKIDCCCLANNHILDWGAQGLIDTITALKRGDVQTAGAGRDAAEARTPAIIDLGPQGRVVVFSLGSLTSGIPPHWAATELRPGIDFLKSLSERSAASLAKRVSAIRRAGDTVIVSIHWGGNWGYDIEAEQREFAHALIDTSGVDLIYGHSSHHPKGIEIYNGKLVLYGCGDFLNDYEGISGYEEFRGNLTLMYLPTLKHGRLISLNLVPMKISRFRLNRASLHEATWLLEVLNREGRNLGSQFQLTKLAPSPGGALYELQLVL